MNVRAAVALLVTLAVAPAWAAKLETVEPQCAAIGAEVAVTGKGLRRLEFSVAGVGTLVTKRSAKRVTILVPPGAPSGPATIAGERGKRSVDIPFVVKGTEVCDGVDNDCNGLVDDVVPSENARCENGKLLLGRRSAGTDLEVCVPGTIEPCYTGPEDTEGVGLCHAGARVCSLDGIWGTCDGEVVPGEEDPGNGIDEDCNGRDGPGGGELCIPGTLRGCYSGPPATRDVGVCHAGARMCGDAGFFGECEGEVTPTTDLPGNGIDEDCDGGDGQRVPLLDVVVNPVLSPTFATSQVLTGMVGTELAPPPATPPPPLVANVAPSAGRQGQSLTVTITGQNATFQDGTTQVSFGAGVTVTSVTVTSASTLSVGVTVAPTASIGPRLVAVTSGPQEAIASNAFNVQPADAQVGGKVADATGAPIAGATVCVSGTAICTTTAADGTFTLPTVPTNATRLIVTKAGFEEFSIAIGDRSGDVNVGLLAFEDTGEPQPPPPQSGAPPLDAKIASVVARLNTTVPELLTPAQARKTVRDFILLVGGDELGLLDAQGAQLNPEITGNGPLSLRPDAVEQLARGFLQGATTTFEQWVFSLALSFQWSGPAPDVDVMLARFQAAVDAAWADPDAAESALMISIFNPGPVFVKDPPRLARVTRISRVATTVLTAAVLIDSLERRTGQGPAGNVALAARSDTMSDAPMLLAQADPQPPIRSFRQLTRALPDMDDVALAISQAIVGSAVFSIPTALAGGMIGLVTIVAEGVGAVAELFFFSALQATLTARLAPLPPTIVGVQADGRVIRIKVQRADKDTRQLEQRVGPRLGRFNYTVYRGCLEGGTRVVVANVSMPFNRDDPDGVFEVVDRRPVPGLNCYYADVVQNVGIDIPPELHAAAAALSGPARIPIIGDIVELLYITELISDYSVPSPFPMPNQPGGEGQDDPTDEQIARSRTTWTPPVSNAGAGPYAFVDKVRADDAGNYYVSDSEAGTITKTLPSRARQPYAVTGFNGPQTGLAIDAQASLYSESVDSESRFSGRTFKFAQPDGARKFTGTVDKYSPLLDRGNEVSVSSLAIGPGVAGGLGDLFAAENIRRRIRRLPTSIIPPAGIEALPAPGHGIFGPLAASPIVGFPYHDFPTCEQGRIHDIDFDTAGTLYAVTDSSLYAVPFDTNSGGAGERRVVAQLGCGNGAVHVDVDGPRAISTRGTRIYTATGSPCAGTFTWSTSDPTVLEIKNQTGTDAGVSHVDVTGLKQGGRAKLIATYETAAGVSSAEMDVFVGGPFIFFHGIGGTAKNWDVLRDYLSQPDQLGDFAFGGELADSKPPAPGCPIGRNCDITPRPGLMYTYNFRNNVGSFIDHADEVGRVIKRVKEVNDVDKVVIVAFSMGGPSVRAYVQNFGTEFPYQGDVSMVVTMNAPHGGSPWPNLSQVPEMAYILDHAQNFIDGATPEGTLDVLRGIRAAIPPPRPNDEGLILLQIGSPALNAMNYPGPLHVPPAGVKWKTVIAKTKPDLAAGMCKWVGTPLDTLFGDYSGVIPAIAPFNFCDFIANSDTIVGLDSQDLNRFFPGLSETFHVEGHHSAVPPIVQNDVDLMLQLMELTPP